MSLAKTFTTVAVAVPLFMVFGFHQPFYIHFVICAVAVGVGHLVAAFVASSQPMPDAGPVSATTADRSWELKMLLKKAAAEERRGDSATAIALFERALQSTASREDVIQVEAEIETARASSQSADFLAHQWPQAGWLRSGINAAS
jgi:hypothetical protein